MVSHYNIITLHQHSPQYGGTSNTNLTRAAFDQEKSPRITLNDEHATYIQDILMPHHQRLIKQNLVTFEIINIQ